MYLFGSSKVQDPALANENLKSDADDVVPKLFSNPLLKEPSLGRFSMFPVETSGTAPENSYGSLAKNLPLWSEQGPLCC